MLKLVDEFLRLSLNDVPEKKHTWKRKYKWVKFLRESFALKSNLDLPVYKLIRYLTTMHQLQSSHVRELNSEKHTKSILWHSIPVVFFNICWLYMYVLTSQFYIIVKLYHKTNSASTFLRVKNCKLRHWNYLHYIFIHWFRIISYRAALTYPLIFIFITWIGPLVK
jgi:hypothetical protein